METDTVEGRKLPEGYIIMDGGIIIGKKGKIIKTHKGSGGYLQLNSWANYKQKTFLIHRLVAILYIKNPLNLPEVNHKDGDKLNNWSWNLEWCTRTQNIQHGFDSGLITPSWKGKSGANHTRSKAVYQCDESGININEFGSIREAGRTTGISSKTINDVLTGKLRLAGGYFWKYKN